MEINKTKFYISAFTHSGTVRESNQDHILIDGILMNKGQLYLKDHNKCICFVADGVGGNKAGDFASFFVLDKLKSVTDFSFPEFVNTLQNINKELLVISSSKNELNGCATTLTGCVIDENVINIFHFGDSQIWLLRNDMFFQITKDQVLDDSVKNSPITNFFGGYEDKLNLSQNNSTQEIYHGDIFMICSDGLFKSLNYKIVKSILQSEKELEIKLNKILENCLQVGAEDNISVILIEQTN